MTKKAVKNIGASIRDRLRNEAKRLGNDFNLILERYALERVLYRLSCSEYKSRFILKGGMLLSRNFGDFKVSKVGKASINGGSEVNIA
jgi:predicted nucleotidyltransferase component of viral defense system